jgi:NADH-quinone oxidoreductase subunit L
MLMLVTSNNFLQLFFGWEAVGLVSYLLIGFYKTRESAIYANLKAFLVNRVGDFGFVLGIGLIYAYFGTLDYSPVFAGAADLAGTTINLLGGAQWPLMAVICICLFVGAMGKSAQVPLHVWLPDSMEGPTPISALIHAATMVTAGIFMVARMSPLFELSDAALSFVTVIGATGALFLGILGIVQNDIKRVVAYSTLSQLGYMTVALGVSDYAGGIFHLMTHACFKALLFLGAGSAIIAMHHDQDMRNMGGLRKYMPITYVTMLIGSLALSGIPPFAGFFSKDESVGPRLAFPATVRVSRRRRGVFVTAFSFRLIFMTFHGHPVRRRAGPRAGARRSRSRRACDCSRKPWVVTLPLIALPYRRFIGWMTIEPTLGITSATRSVAPAHPAIDEFRAEWHGIGAFMLHGVTALPFWLALAGIGAAWYLYLVQPALPARIAGAVRPLYTLLDNKYYFDRFNEWFFAGGARRVGNFLFNVGDRSIIDGFFVNGTAKVIGWSAALMRHIQSGYVYHYAFTMIVGVFALLTWWTH